MILFDVQIGGRNISSALQPVLKQITVTDGSDDEADGATIVTADVDGQTFMANKRDPVSIMLGGTGSGIGLVFDGFVDEPRSKGDRSGRELHIECTSVDLEGPAKAPREDFWDDKTLGDILSAAFGPTGVSIMVDPKFASLHREFESMDGRDPMSFAADMAREVGATFKMMGNRAVFAQRNSGLALSGLALPVFVATWGDNLLSWDISPQRPRAAFSEFSRRWFDFAKNKYVEETESSSGKAIHRKNSPHATQAIAKDASGASKDTAERDAGAGTITVLGDFRAQAGGKCHIVGARSAVDGTYIISSVEHNASRGSGFVSTLELKHPEGGAGVDSR